MVAIKDLLARFRRAGRDTFNAHFFPYAETERDFEVFAHVLPPLFQVMVLDFLQLHVPTRYGEPATAIRLRPIRDGVPAGLQHEEGGTTVTLDSTCAIAFCEFLDSSGPYEPWELDLVRGKILEHETASLVGREVIVAWLDIEVLGESKF